MKRNTFRLDGVNMDLPPYLVGPEWTRVENMVSRRGFMNRSGGYRTAEPAENPYWLDWVENFSGRRWVYAADTAAGRKLLTTNGVTVDDISPALGVPVGDGGAWSMAVCNRFYAFNVAGAKPFYWNGSTASPCVPLPGWFANATCNGMIGFRNYLIGYNFVDGANNYSNQVRWSASAAPGGFPAVWTPALGNDAGDAELADSPGEIVAAGLLRDQCVFYMTDAIYTLQWVGGGLVMALRKFMTEMGALGRHAVAHFRNGHLVVGPTDIYIHDLNKTTSIVNKRIGREIYYDADIAQPEKWVVFDNILRREVWICYPEKGATHISAAAVWNYVDDRWGIIRLGDRKITWIAAGPAGMWGNGETSWDGCPYNWANAERIWNVAAARDEERNVVGCSVDDDRILLVDTSGAADGEDLSSYIERQNIEIEPNDRFKVVTAVIPEIRAAPGSAFRVRVGVTERPTDAPDYTDVTEFVVGRDWQILVNRTGRYISFSVEASQYFPWSIVGFSLRYRIAAQYGALDGGQVQANTWAM